MFLSAAAIELHREFLKTVSANVNMRKCPVGSPTGRAMLAPTDGSKCEPNDYQFVTNSSFVSNFARFSFRSCTYAVLHLKQGTPFTTIRLFFPSAG